MLSYRVDLRTEKDATNKELYAEIDSTKAER